MNAHLPFFPIPYPDESLYSLLCRYHVRSGNRNDRATVLQLFGSTRSLLQSLLTPSLISYSCRWYNPDARITDEKLLYENTAFQYYCIWSTPEKQEIIRSSIKQQAKTHTAVNNMTHEISRCKMNLYYCPECAKEDQQIFGESYWHILPQLNCVEYCPTHKCRLVKSAIQKKDICYHFLAASEYINPNDGVPSSEQEHSSEIMDEYIKIAADSAWLLKNGKLIDKKKADARISLDVFKTYCTTEENEIHSQVLYISHLYNIIRGGVSKLLWEDIRKTLNNPSENMCLWDLVYGSVIGRIAAIHCIYGSIENFYNKLINDTDATAL